MGFNSQLGKEFKNLSTYAGAKAGSSVGKTLHTKLMRNDETHQKYAKYKAKFQSSLSGADRMLYSNICDLEKEHFYNSNPLKFITTGARLKSQRAKLARNLNDYQKELFTKVNRLAANILKDEVKFVKNGKRLGKLSMTEFNNKVSKL